MRKVHTLFGILPLLLVLTSTGTCTHSSIHARLVGTVWDQSGAVIPGVKVTATARATDFSKTVVTDDGGKYIIGNLIPGRYDIDAELAGSKTIRFEAHDVLLEEGQVARVDFAKQPSNLE